MSKINTSDALAELITGILSETIEEAALNAPAISKNENIALFFKNEGKSEDSIFAVLFDWKRALEAAKKDRVSYNIDRSIQPFVVGFVKIKAVLEGETDVRTIALSAAEPGYGPLMYDVGLAMAYPNYLAADRGSVSEKAQKVWDYYFSKRTDVEKKALFDPKTDGWGAISGTVIPNDVYGSERFRTIQRSIWERNRLVGYLLDMDDRLAHGDASVTDPRTGQQTTQKAIKTEIARLESELSKLLAEEPLAYKYRMKGPTAQEGPALARLIQRGKAFKEKLLGLRKKEMQHYDDHERNRWASTQLRQAGEGFFGKKYTDESVKKGAPLKKEAALSAPALAKNNNLALVFRNKGDEGEGRYAILFDWKKSWLSLKKTLRVDSQFFSSAIKPFVVAYISTSDVGATAGKASDFIDLSNVQTVNLAAAEQGHGPIMYDIAIAMAYPNYLCSDRISSSKEATAVWHYYFNKRTDVEKVMIADPRKVPAKHFRGIGLPALAIDQVDAQALVARKGNLEEQIRDEEGAGFTNLLPGLNAELQKVNEELFKLMQNNPLAYKYRMKGPSAKEGPALAKLIQRGEEFKKKVKGELEAVFAARKRGGIEGSRYFGQPDDLADRNVNRAGVNFFSDKYGQSTEKE